MRARLKTFLASESGTSLVELLVALPMSALIAGAAIALTGAFGHSEKRVGERADAVASAQVALERLTRDVRQSSGVTVTSQNVAVPTLQLDKLVSSSSTPQTVLWACEAVSGTIRATCNRFVCTDGQSTAAVPKPAIPGDPTDYCRRNKPTARFTIQLSAVGASPDVFTVENFDAGTSGGLATGRPSTYVKLSALVPTAPAPTSTTPTTTVPVTAGAAMLNQPVLTS